MIFKKNSEGMWVGGLTKDVILKAKAAASTKTVNNARTMLDKGQKAPGAIGEVVVESFFSKERLKTDNTVNHDVRILGANGKWYTADIKTKAVRRDPRGNHEQSVFAYTVDRQHPDMYIFVSIIEPDGRKDFDANYQQAYICGFMPSTWIGTNKMTFRPAGAVMPGSGIIAKEDNYFIQLKDLMKFKDQR